MNSAGVYGPGDLKPTGRFILGSLNGRVPGFYKASTSIVYIDDVGIGHLLVASKGKVGKRYILSGDRVTMHEWSGLLSRLYGARVPPTVPMFLGGMTASFGEIISRFTNRPPVLSKETFKLTSHGFQVDGTKATEELGIEYTPLAEGLHQTIKWCWEQGLLKREPACLTENFEVLGCRDPRSLSISDERLRHYVTLSIPILHMFV